MLTSNTTLTQLFYFGALMTCLAVPYLFGMVFLDVIMAGLQISLAIARVAVGIVHGVFVFMTGNYMNLLSTELGDKGTTFDQAVTKVMKTYVTSVSGEKGATGTPDTDNTSV